MQDLTSTRSLVVAALFLAVGAWWLANTSLQASIGFANVPAFGVHAAHVLVLGQALLIALLGVHDTPDTWREASLAAVSFIVPMWPLLALIWLTSELSMLAVATSQTAAFVLAIAVASIARGISRIDVGNETRAMLRAAAGVALAAAVWIGRGQLHTWVTG